MKLWYGLTASLALSAVPQLQILTPSAQGMVHVLFHVSGPKREQVLRQPILMVSFPRYTSAIGSSSPGTRVFFGIYTDGADVLTLSF